MRAGLPNAVFTGPSASVTDRAVSHRPFACLLNTVRGTTHTPQMKHYIYLLVLVWWRCIRYWLTPRSVAAIGKGGGGLLGAAEVGAGTLHLYALGGVPN